ncbi:MAG: hypothetical protein JXA61_03565 [Bacteroidales bacterium]|nr:hypothetical protein [Bacteroidales bacterium]
MINDDLTREELMNRVIHYIQLAQEEKVEYQEFYSCKKRDNLNHEFLFFMKPELTCRSDSLNLKAILNTTCDEITKFSLRIRDIRILSSQYLKSYHIIARHYGVINSLSSNATAHISEAAAEKFASVFGSTVSSVTMLGGAEFLQQFAWFNPLTLDELWQKSLIVRLAPGTYCAKTIINGKEVYLVNGFHPRQLSHYTDQACSIVAFTLAGDLDWHRARNHFIGKTNPAEAKPGSLRNILYVNRTVYGLQNVSTSRNGFHLSAGPVEGLVELIRYNSNCLTGESKKISDFTFGRMLQAHFSMDRIGSILDNRIVQHKNKYISIFDLTEEKNNDEAIQLLKDVADDL